MLGAALASAAGAGASRPEPLAVHGESGVHRFAVEVAETAETRARGLMGRKSLAPGSGMIFLYPRPAVVTMWMKDTPLSLDMLFIDGNGTVVGLATCTTPFSEDMIPSPGPVGAVLELPGGRVADLGIRKGDCVEFREITCGQR